MAKFCASCGTQLIDVAKFCASCGRAQPQVPPPPSYGPAPWAPPWPPAVPMGQQQPQQIMNQPQGQRPQAAQGSALTRIKGNGAYVAWFLFYFVFFSVITVGIAIPIYIITILIAFSSIAEKLWCRVSGVRPLRLKSEKDRLAPLFMEVYRKAVEADANLYKGIKLYIKEDMTINAFAFGSSTLILTRGSLELLNDDCLKGLIAHEFGHFSHGDTEAILLATVSNFFMSYIISKLTDRKNRYESENQGGVGAGIVKGIYRLFKAIDFIGEVILKRTSRRNEYLADQFAERSGFAKELTDVLIEIYAVSISKPQSVKEQLKSTHPDITLRIERLEEALYS